MVLFLTSCIQRVPEESTLTANSICISGDAKANMEVVDGNYKMKTAEDKVIIPVKFKVTQPIKIYGEKPEVGNINLVPLDQSGVPVSNIGLNFKPATMGDWDKFGDLLTSESNEEITIVFEWNYFGDTDKQVKIMNETKSFEIIGADFTNSKPISSASRSNTTVKTQKIKKSKKINQSNKNDWDKALDSYEDYIDKYIVLLKKVQNGDSAAMSEYSEMMQKATEMAEKMQNASEDLSTTQMNRFMKLQSKLANAAASI